LAEIVGALTLRLVENASDRPLEWQDDFGRTHRLEVGRGGTFALSAGLNKLLAVGSMREVHQPRGGGPGELPWSTERRRPFR
jgi:hypothetical protein